MFGTCWQAVPLAEYHAMTPSVPLNLFRTLSDPHHPNIHKVHKSEHSSCRFQSLRTCSWNWLSSNIKIKKIMTEGETTSWLEFEQHHQKTLIVKVLFSTSRFGSGVMERMCVDMGNMFSSSSITTQALQAASESINLSLNRPVTSPCDSVRNLAWTSWQEWQANESN